MCNICSNRTVLRWSGPPVGVLDLAPPVGLAVDLAPSVGVVDLAPAVGVDLASPVMADLASPVGVVDRAVLLETRPHTNGRSAICVKRWRQILPEQEIVSGKFSEAFLIHPTMEQFSTVTSPQKGYWRSYKRGPLTMASHERCMSGDVVYLLSVRAATLSVPTLQ